MGIDVSRLRDGESWCYMENNMAMTVWLEIGKTCCFLPITQQCVVKIGEVWDSGIESSASWQIVSNEFKIGFFSHPAWAVMYDNFSSLGGIHDVVRSPKWYLYVSEEFAVSETNQLVSFLNKVTASC